MDQIKSEYLHIRVSSKLKEDVKTQANEEGRSMSNYVETQLRLAIYGPEEEENESKEV